MITIKSRLRKNVFASDQVSPVGLIFKDLDYKIVDKDKITDITYGPSIPREWLSNEPIDNPEWILQQDK